MSSMTVIESLSVSERGRGGSTEEPRDAYVRNEEDGEGKAGACVLRSHEHSQGGASTTTSISNASASLLANLHPQCPARGLHGTSF